MRIAESLPGYCSVCYGACERNQRYIDFEVAHDGAPVLDRDTGTIAVLPWDGLQSSHDDLVVCESCLKAAGELLGLKPELHARQLREIRRLEIERDHWRDTARRAREELGLQVDANLAPPVASVRRNQRVKVA